jgi:radical SAM superfamily enzyme YgiQ (UPF0313 family)
MIILSTLNARFTHTSIGLRYLYANMQELQKQTEILEFSINDAIQSIAEEILEHEPKIVGLGVYIWNATQIGELVEIIKKVSPDTMVILGGPEVSYTPFRVNYDLADYIIQGEGDSAFYKLCCDIQSNNLPQEKIIKPIMADLGLIVLPYEHYSDDDIANRYVYVEASRGCPFLCEFCLSSIDEKVRNFDVDLLLIEFEKLWQRGVRNYKFIDRTFNLNIKFANKILDFFLSKDEKFFAHFEVIPDHFPEVIKEKIKLFPPESLQLEVGIQTLNPEISENISRPLKLKKIKDNLTFLETQTKVHMHVDLIVGLPGENLESFGKNLNELKSMVGCEIQIGILKKLSGTTIDRHDIEYKMVYSDIPPYDVLSTKDVSFKELQKMKRFARFWDIAYNSGNFQESMVLLFDDNVYKNFSHFSQWIYETTKSTWKISLDRFSELVYIYLVEIKGLHESDVIDAIMRDVLKVDGRNLPKFLKAKGYKVSKTINVEKENNLNKRQTQRAE